MSYGLSNEDRCIICGQYAPEGRQVCAQCEKEIINMNKSPIKPKKITVKEWFAAWIDAIIKKHITIDVD